jgi:hypothetical protein
MFFFHSRQVEAVKAQSVVRVFRFQQKKTHLPIFDCNFDDRLSGTSRHHPRSAGIFVNLFSSMVFIA